MFCLILSPLMAFFCWRKKNAMLEKLSIDYAHKTEKAVWLFESMAMLCGFIFLMAYVILLMKNF